MVHSAYHWNFLGDHWQQGVKCNFKEFIYLGHVSWTNDFKTQKGCQFIFLWCREYQLLPIEWLNRIWRPDSYFKNAKQVTFQTMTIPNHYVWLYRTKKIFYMVKYVAFGEQTEQEYKFWHFAPKTQNIDLIWGSMFYGKSSEKWCN